MEADPTGPDAGGTSFPNLINRTPAPPPPAGWGTVLANVQGSGAVLPAAPPPAGLGEPELPEAHKPAWQKPARVLSRRGPELPEAHKAGSEPAGSKPGSGIEAGGTRASRSS